MHFYYLDEAGCTGHDLANPEQPVFVLGGLSVRDEGWNQTQQAFFRVISDYFPSGIPDGFELHAEELLSPNGDGPFSGHKRERRNELAINLLRLLEDRSHDAHLFAIDKKKLDGYNYSINDLYDTKIPYLVAYDYLITHINWFLKKRLGPSARGMLIIDAKEQFHEDIERITHYRRFRGPEAHRVKWIVEFSYPIDSQKNPMVQLSDLIVFCTKKFFEVECGYRSKYSPEAKNFFAKCYALIHDRIPRKTLVDRQGRGMEALNTFLRKIQAKPVGQWKMRYGL